MMVGPAAFYAFELKGKSEAQLRAKIAELREDMKRLREEMQADTYLFKPGPDVQLAAYREYLALARAELTFKKYGIH